MHTVLLRSGVPTSLALAADPRLGSVDYCNDQIWELTVGRGEPSAITLQTTYGLRARGMRVFPRFAEGDQFVNDPDAFASPIKLEFSYPNALQIIFAPFTGISAQITYWIPQSQVAAGHIVLTNHSKEARRLSMEWAVILAPGSSGERMSVQEFEAAHVLAGSSQDLAPVFFITGGAKPGGGSYSSLILSSELAPGESRSYFWAIATLAEHKASFELARQITSKNWAGEMARIELLNAGLMDIHTGDENWNLAFERCQKIACSLFTSATAALPHPSFVITRQPDQGFSLRGDGSDYNHLWNGQSAPDAYYLAEQLLPVAPQLMRGILRNFISTQSPTGEIDWKPGLGGQRSQFNAAPLLASLAWQIYQATADKTFLKEVFPPLSNFYSSWFSPPRDQDNDGIPEWTHASQTGWDEHPIFTRWPASAHGVDPETVESPDLCAYLYHECSSLCKIAEVIQRPELIPAVQAAAENLKAAVEASWSQQDSIYHYWDRDTHASPSRELQLLLQWPDLPEFPIHFSQPLRLQVNLASFDGSNRRVQLFLHGSGTSGGHLVEPFSPESFSWNRGQAMATSQRSYTSVDHLEVQGLASGDSLQISSIDFTHSDITLLLPLWAGISSPEHAAALVTNTITNPERFWAPFGLRCAVPVEGQAEGPTQEINLQWNAKVVEGLLTYGYRSVAVELLTRLMNVTALNLVREGCFRYSYHPGTGKGLKERDALNGLPPLSLFLKVLGVQWINTHQIILHGFNPFPWPVTVKYRGTTVLCQKDKTTVIYPDGQTTTLSETGTYLISMDRAGAVKQP